MINYKLLKKIEENLDEMKSIAYYTRVILPLKRYPDYHHDAILAMIHLKASLQKTLEDAEGLFL